MLMDFNFQEGPLLMFSVAVVIVAVIFLFLSGVFAVAELVACLFEKRPIAPALYAWFLACGIVFLSILSFAAAFPALVGLFEQKRAEAFIHNLENAPFYIGIPLGLVAVAGIALLLVRFFDALVTTVIVRVAIALASGLSLVFALMGLFRFTQTFFFRSILGAFFRIQESDLGFYLINGFLLIGFTTFSYYRLSKHAVYFVPINGD